MYWYVWPVLTCCPLFLLSFHHCCASRHPIVLYVLVCLLLTWPFSLVYLILSLICFGCSSLSVNMNFESPAWRECLARPSLSYVLKILTGLCTSHHPTQVSGETVIWNSRALPGGNPGYAPPPPTHTHTQIKLCM